MFLWGVPLASTPRCSNLHPPQVVLIASGFLPAVTERSRMCRRLWWVGFPWSLSIVEGLPPVQDSYAF
jgi:hypothetical protein